MLKVLQEVEYEDLDEMCGRALSASEFRLLEFYLEKYHPESEGFKRGMEALDALR